MGTNQKLTDSQYPDEITFSDLLMDIWKYRVVITIFVSLTLLLCVIGFYVLNPVRYKTSCVVGLNFPGIEKKAYPDGSPFSKDDILAPSIIAASIKKTDFDIKTLRGMLTIKAINPPNIKDKQAEEKGYIFPSNQFVIALQTDDSKSISSSAKEKIIYEIIKQYRDNFYRRFYYQFVENIETIHDGESKIIDPSEVLTLIDAKAKSLLSFLNHKMDVSPMFTGGETGLSFDDLIRQVTLFYNKDYQTIERRVASYGLIERQNMINKNYNEYITELKKQAELKSAEAKIILNQMVKAVKDFNQTSYKLNQLSTDHIDSKSHGNLGLFLSNSLERICKLNNDLESFDSQVDNLTSERDALLKKNESDVCDKDTVEISSMICIALDKLHNLVTLTNRLSHEYQKQIKADGVVILKDPVEERVRDASLSFVLLVSLFAATMIAVLTALIVQYIKRIM